ncbi:hypothetical protein D3C77_550190 [compost metagenome]
MTEPLAVTSISFSVIEPIAWYVKFRPVVSRTMVSAVLLLVSAPLNVRFWASMVRKPALPFWLPVALLRLMDRSVRLARLST